MKPTSNLFQLKNNEAQNITNEEIFVINPNKDNNSCENFNSYSYKSRSPDKKYNDLSKYLAFFIIASIFLSLICIIQLYSATVTNRIVLDNIQHEIRSLRFFIKNNSENHFCNCSFSISESSEAAILTTKLEKFPSTEENNFETSDLTTTLKYDFETTTKKIDDLKTSTTNSFKTSTKIYETSFQEKTEFTNGITSTADFILSSTKEEQKDENLYLDIKLNCIQSKNIGKFLNKKSNSAQSPLQVFNAISNESKNAIYYCRQYCMSNPHVFYQAKIVYNISNNKNLTITHESFGKTREDAKQSVIYELLKCVSSDYTNFNLIEESPDWYGSEKKCDNTLEMEYIKCPK